MACNYLSDDIKFRLLTSDTFKETLTLMIDNFFPNGPLSQCLTIFQNKIDPKFDINKYRRETIGKLIRACPMTMIAQDKSNKDKVVGVLIAGLVEKYDKEGRKNEYYDLELSNKEYIKRLIENHKVVNGYEEATVHLITLERSLIQSVGDFWTKYDCNEVLEIKFLNVDTKYGKRGIGKELIRRTIHMGKIFGIKAAIAESTGIYSQSAFKKAGFETLAKFYYKDYPGKDVDGRNVFEHTGIHKSCDFVAREISSLRI